MSCFEKLTDILRTRISVRYLDGAIFVANKLEQLADSLKLKHKLVYKAKEEGFSLSTYIVEEDYLEQ